MVLATSSAAQVKTEEAQILPLTNDGVEEYVRMYFAKTPILAEIARCESKFRQYGTDGNVLRGEIVSQDLGVMQINEYYHGSQAVKLGLDLRSLEDNVAYAKILYERQGTQPWSASAYCWNK